MEGIIFIFIFFISPFLFFYLISRFVWKKEKKKDKSFEALNKNIKHESKITLNPIKWGKYTSIITSAEKKFVDIFNFQTPQEYKKSNLISSLANTLLFEESRLKRLSPNDFEELLAGFGGDRDFHKFIKPVGNNYFDFKTFKAMYSSYIDFRAREIRPIISMMLVLSSIDGKPVRKEEIEELTREYEANPIFGRAV